MLILLTNGSTAAYRRDLFNACCLPRHARISFSYRDAWIAPEVKNQNDDFWRDHWALIAYYDPRTKGPDGAMVDCSIPEKSPQNIKGSEFRFVPIRYAKIEDVRKHEGGRTFELKLDDWYRYIGEHAGAVSDVDSFNSRVQTNFLRRPRPTKALTSRATGDDATLFVYYDEPEAICPRKDITKGRQEDDWARFVCFVRTVPGLRDGCFIWCSYGSVGQKRHRRAWWRHKLIAGPLLKRDVHSDITRLEVRGQSHHRITLYVVPGADAYQRVPEFQMNDDYITCVGPFATQFAGGQTYSYRLYVRPTLVPCATAVRVAAPDLDESYANSVLASSDRRDGWKVGGPHLMGEVLVHPNRWQLMTAVACFALGTLLGGIDSYGLSVLLGIDVADVDTNAPAAVVYTVTKVCGVLFTVAGAILALRRGITRVLG